MSKGAAIEDIYQLAPMQEGMLFHSVYATGVEVYFQQAHGDMFGEFNRELFKQAWDDVIARHAVLRTAFYWENLDAPMQVVMREARMPWTELDWREVSAEKLEDDFQHFLREDRAEGFALGSAPLMRFALLRLTEDKYRFVWSFHHIVLDGWSTAIVLADVLEAYQARLAGRELDKKAPLPFKHYVEYVKQRDPNSAKAFWREYLNGVTAPSLVQMDRMESGAAVAEVRGEYIQSLGRELTDALSGSSRSLGTTVNAIVQAAWTLALAIETGRADVIFGATVSGRPANLERVEEIVGLLINTLPVRKQINWQLSAADLIRELSADHAVKDEYAQTPLSDIAACSDLGRGAELFDSLLVFENFPMLIEPDSQRDLQFDNFGGFERTNFALTILVIPGTELGLRWVYDGAALSHNTVERLAEFMQHILQAFTRNVNRPLLSLALTDASQTRALRTLSRGTTTKPSASNLIELFDNACREHADKTALVDSNTRLSYAEMQHLSNAMAQVLRANGVGLGDVVGIQLERSAVSAVVLSAVLRCGAAYLALDPVYPQERRTFMAQDADLKLLISASADSDVGSDLNSDVGSSELAELYKCEQLSLDELLAELEGERHSKVELPVFPGERTAAYLMYTSGSTGRPKGVVHEHAALINLIYWQVNDSEFSSGARSAQLASYSFDVSFQELFATWVSGGELHIVSEDVKRDPGLLLQQIASAQLERITLPYVGLRSLASHALEAKTAELQLREILTSGEQLVADAAIQEWVGSLGARLRNQYGPTESHVCTDYVLPRNVAEWSVLPPIGRPVNNCEVYILDANLRPLPRGFVGELYLAGRSLARGYVNRPGQTAERFVPNPLGRAGERMYRSGDLARWTADGNLEFVGRADAQVKIRGYRVEPGEIEQVLQACSGVRAAAVTLRGSGDEARLLAFVCCDSQVDPDLGRIRNQLAAVLPDYMLPSVYTVLENLPLTSSGKIDRRALQQIAPEGAGRALDRSVPRTPSEEVILGIWRSLLDNQTLGIHADFFDAGGHSLLATRLVARLRPIFQREIPVRLVFENPSVAALSAALAAIDKSDKLHEIPFRTADAALLLAPAQLRLWFIEILQGASPQYNLPAAVKLRGDLDQRALQTAVKHLVARHAVLRTRILNDAGSARPLLADAAEFEVDVQETSADIFHDADKLQERVAQIAWQPFSLDIDLPIRCSLLRASATEHVLVLVVHHIAFDGWSQSVLVREFSEIYGLLSRGETLPARKRKLDYHDLAAWWGSPDGEANLAEDLDYWREVFAAEVAVLQLPADKSRPEERKYNGATYNLEFDAETTAALHALAREQNSSLYMLLLAAYVWILARHANVKDVVVATPVANRRRTEFESIIGFFVNTLPLRFSVDFSSELSDLLQHVRTVTLEAFNHQDAPFDKIVEAVQSGRDLGSTPLAQTSFILQNTPEPVLELPGLQSEVVELAAPNVKHEIDMVFMELADAGADAIGTENGTRLIGAIDYDRDVFSADEIENLALRFRRALQLILRDRTLSLQTSELLSDVDNERLDVLRGNALPLPVVGSGESGFAAEGTADDILASSLEYFALHSPDSEALVSAAERLTYAQLNARVNQWAHLFVRQGVRPGDRIVLLLGNHFDYSILLSAALKCAASFVPVNVNSPDARLQLIVQECAPRLLVHADSNWESEVDCPVLSLEQAGHQLISMPETNPGIGAHAEQAAYCIFTSGSTGKPKGVEVPRQALKRTLHSFCSLTEIGPESRVLGYVAPGFDAVLLEALGPLMVGACICSAASISRVNPSDVQRDTSVLQPTHLHFAVALYATLLESGLQVDTSVTDVIVGGDVLHDAIAQLHHDRLPAVKLHNGYGPTETTIMVTQDYVKQLPVSLGKPLDFVGCYILDQSGQRQIPGVAGELFIGGPALAQGYLNNPRQTASVFLPDPWATEPGSRMYRTGDIVRLRQGDKLEFHGRSDNQVKVRGVRVEPGELENTLMSHPLVARAQVTVRRDEAEAGSENSLHVFCTLQAGSKAESAINVKELNSFLAARLPEYLQPTTLNILDEFPLTTNAKIDVKALNRLIVLDKQAEEFVAPLPGLETDVAAVWSALLDNAKIGRHDDFFRRGGHSLLAVRAGARLAETLGIEPPVQMIFRHPTLSRYAAALAEVSATGSLEPQEQGLELLPREHPAERPLSFAQERLWFLDQLEGGGRVYLMPMMLRLRGTLTVSDLSAALNKLVQRHEQLRSMFPAINGQARQVPVEASRLEVGRIERDEEYTLQEQLEAEALREVEQDFDLQSQLPIRARLLDIAADDKVLIVTLHHIVADGWSMGILADELGAILRGEDLQALDISYADFAAWQRDEARLKRDEAQLDYWRTALADAPEALDLPTDRPRPAQASHRGAVYNWELDAETTAILKQQCAAQGMTLSMSLSGLWAVLLARFCGTDDISIGMPVANRRPAVTEKIVGLYLNTVVLRVRPEPLTSLHEVLEQVRESSLAALANQDVPFERVVEAVQPSRSLSRTPLFQVMFVMHNMPSGALERQGLKIESLEMPVSGARFDLTLTCRETESGIACSVEYALDLFGEDSVRRLAELYSGLIASVQREQHTPVAALPLNNYSSRHAEVITPPAARFRGGVHVFFEAWAQRDGDKPAIRFEGKTYRFAQVNALANSVARALNEQGAGPEQVIGICAERSPEMIAALFGILKTGAAFLPLEPSLPAERLAGMIADANANLVLCDAVGELVLKPVECRKMPLLSIKPQEFDSTNFPTPLLGRDSAAYVVFTSGSTGRPKGALNTHGALWNRLAWMEEYLDMGPLDRVLHKTPISFDVSVWELILPLCTGGLQVIARPEGHRDAAYLASLIQSEGVTILHFVPPMLRVFLEEASAEQLSQVRHIICSGEALSPDLVELTHRSCVAEVHNLYGPTEAAIDVSAWRTTLASERSVPIGHAIDGVELLVLDAFMQPLPPGVPGELYIGGVALARCYAGKSAQTAEAFVPHPYADGARLYRTGDIARRRPDGAIEFVGRRDHQIKLRGFRIELGEIEQQSQKLHWVRNSVAVVRERAVYLFAEAEATHQGTQDAELLMEHLRRILPEYMLPQEIVLMAQMPLTPNGKIDRRRLPAIRKPDDELTYVAPRSAHEALLADIWADVLGRKRVGIHDNYFALGGDSILSIQILARARTAGLHLTVRDVFERQTIAELAVMAGRGGIVQAEQGSVTGRAPLTAIQEWMFAQDLQNPNHFNQSLMFQVPVDFDAERAYLILNRLAEHHDALRTQFVKHDATWEQVWNAESNVPIVWKSAQILSADPAVQVERLEKHCAQLQAAFDLKNGPVFGGAYFKMAGSAPGRFLILAHHLVVDGVSWRILLEDFVQLYRSPGSLTGVELPSKSTAYRDWARAQQQWANQDLPQSVQAEWQAWLRRKGGRLPLLPEMQAAANPDSVNTNLAAEEVNLVVVPELARALTETVASIRGCSTDEILLAAIARVLTRLAAAEHVRIDVEGHGRDTNITSMDLSRTVGWFTTILPLLVTPDVGGNVLHDLKAIKQALRGAPHGAAAYGALRYVNKDNSVRESMQACPPADLLYNNHGNVRSGSDEFLKPAGERGGPMYAPENQRSHRLEINAITQDGQLAIVLRYAAALYDAELIDALCSGIRDELAALLAQLRTVKSPIQTPSDFPLFTMSQTELDAVTDGRFVQDILPITAAQRGMLVESISVADRNLHVEQHVYSLTSMRDPQQLKDVWQRTLLRHESLRAAFVWSPTLGPMQLIEHDVRLPWRRVVLLTNDPADRDEERRRLIENELAQPFNLERAPLMRLLYIDEGEGRASLVWTHHHILVDGWSVGLVLRELLAGIGQETTTISRPAPLRSYMQWLTTRDREAAQAWWQNNCKNVKFPTPLGQAAQAPATIAPDTGFGHFDRAWSVHESEMLRAAAREARTTSTTYLHAAWALVLAANSGRQYVAFGATVSGRPADLPGTEEMTGMFINTLPVVIEINAENTVAHSIGRIHAAALERREFEWNSAGEIHDWVGADRGAGLFDSLLVVENFPAGHSEAESAGLELGDFQARGAQTAHPITLMLAESDRLHLRMVFQNAWLNQATADLLLQQLQCALKLLVQSREQTIAAIIAEVRQLGTPELLQHRSHTDSIPKQVSLASTSELTKPSNRDEQVVFEIWSELLQRDNFSVTDNFFDLGGSSLLAVRMIQRLNQVCKRNIAPADLLRAGNIVNIAQMLANDEEKVWTPLVALAENSDKAVMLLVHPAGGNVMCYHELARALSGELSVYGLQAMGLRDGQNPIESIAEMAAFYLDSVEAEMAGRDLFIAGWSFGGAVAQEMAVQARQRLLPLRQVFIIDSYPMADSDEAMPRDEAELLAAIVKEHFDVDPDNLRAHSANMLEYLVDKMHAAGALDANVGHADAQRMIDVFRRNTSMQHKPQHFDGTMMILRAAEHPAPFDGVELLQRWNGLANSVKDAVIGGTHDTIVYAPHVNRMADVILAECQEQRQGSRPKSRMQGAPAGLPQFSPSDKQKGEP